MWEEAAAVARGVTDVPSAVKLLLRTELCWLRGHEIYRGKGIRFRHADSQSSTTV